MIVPASEAFNRGDVRILDENIKKRIRAESLFFVEIPPCFYVECHIAPLSGVFIVSAVTRRTEVTGDRDC